VSGIGARVGQIALLYVLELLYARLSGTSPNSLYRLCSYIWLVRTGLHAKHREV
jgi:hypothetical protein